MELATTGRVVRRVTRRHPLAEPSMPADPIRRTIELGPSAHELRRHVGPTAWVVLEEMLQRSTSDDGHVVAQVSIRSLASSLGLGENTVTPPSVAFAISV